MRFALLTTAFHEGEEIPALHTAEGEDLSPPLTWSTEPEATRQLALVCEDPDASSPEPWVHWVIYNIPAGVHSLPAAIPNQPRLGEPHGVAQGQNSFRDGAKLGYRGPAPPAGHGIHHYHFRLYALDTPLDLDPGLTKSQLLRSIKRHILEVAELVGTYER